MIRLLALVIIGVVIANAAQAAVFYPTSFTLDNGLQVIVVPNHISPAVSQMVWYKAGSADEVPGKTGLAHYLEHLMFRGTTDIPAGEFSKRIATQGGNDNAFTAYDYTAYFETVAADRLPMIMKMEADRMRNLRITPNTAAPELSVVLNERDERTDNNPQGKFTEKFRYVLLGDHTYGRPVIGWKPEIEKLNVADANDFYHHHYAPNNAVVIISGDVEPEAVKKLAEDIYGRLPKAEVALRPALPAPLAPKQKHFTLHDVGVEQPMMQWASVAESYNTQKAGEAYALEVLADALDSGEVGLLYQDLVVKQNLASGMSINYEPEARGSSLFSITASPRKDVRLEKLEKAMTDALQRFAKNGIDEKTVAAAKQRLSRQAIFARDSLMVPGYSFGMAITTGRTIDEVESWPDHIAGVTRNSVNEALQHLVASKFSVTGFLLPDPHAPPAARKAVRSVPTQDGEIR